MSDDKIEEIRARHSRDDRWRNLPSMICPQAHDDRALLLAEVERLREEIERLREMMLDIAVELRGEEPRIVFRIRKALEGKP